MGVFYEKPGHRRRSARRVWASRRSQMMGSLNRPVRGWAQKSRLVESSVNHGVFGQKGRLPRNLPKNRGFQAKSELGKAKKKCLIMI